MILETARLQLRLLTPADKEALHCVLSDPIAMEHYPKPFSQEMTHRWIEWNLRNYQEFGFGLWAVIHKQDSVLIGDCGLTMQSVDGIAELEIGYHISRAYWGQGLATEAAIACKEYAFNVLQKDRVISWMGPANLASRRVAEKVGMRLEKTSTDRNGNPAVVYAITRPDTQG